MTFTDPGVPEPPRSKPHERLSDGGVYPLIPCEGSGEPMEGATIEEGGILWRCPVCIVHADVEWADKWPDDPVSR